MAAISICECFRNPHLRTFRSRVSFSSRSLSRPTFLSVRGIAQSVSRDHASGRGKGASERRSRFWARKCRALQLIFEVEEDGDSTVVICFKAIRINYPRRFKKKSGNRCNCDTTQDIPPRPRKILSGGGGGRHVCPIVRRIRFGRFH